MGSHPNQTILILSSIPKGIILHSHLYCQENDVYPNLKEIALTPFNQTIYHSLSRKLQQKSAFQLLIGIYLFLCKEHEYDLSATK